MKDGLLPISDKLEMTSNQVDHTWLQSHLEICKYELAKIVLVERGLRPVLTWALQRVHLKDNNLVLN
jgi:hypothetical protein